MKGICYFGARNKNYPRNNGFIRSIQFANIPLTKCFVNSTLSSFKRHGKLIRKFLKLDKTKFDTILLCEFQPTLIPLTYILCKLYKKRFIFDFESSFYESLENRDIDNKLKKLYFIFLDLISVYLPDLVLTTTKNYKKFISDFYKVNASKIKYIYYAIPSNPNEILAYKPENKFIVSCITTFIHGSGVEYIIKSANILKDHNILFNIYGSGQTFNKAKELTKSLNLKNIIFHGRIPHSEIENIIINSHIMLGNMKKTEKTNKCIPLKVFETISYKRTLITMDVDAVRELFTDKKDIILCKESSAEDITQKILFYKENPELLKKIAENGFNVHKKHFSFKNTGKKFKNLF